MVPLSQIYDDLTYGELANVALSGELNGDKGIQPGNYPIIIRHINSCLNDLFTRFHLRDKQVVVRQIADKVNYLLHSDYALSDPIDPDEVWIIDSEEHPFEDDIIRVIAVRGSEDDWIALDDYLNPESVYMSSYNVLSITSPIADKELTLKYRAKHPLIDPTSVDTQFEVDIPETLREPLLWYIASRVFASRTGQDDRALSVEYYSRYVNRCDELERDGVFQLTEENSNFMFMLGGWL